MNVGGGGVASADGVGGDVARADASADALADDNSDDGADVAYR